MEQVVSHGEFRTRYTDAGRHLGSTHINVIVVARGFYGNNRSYLVVVILVMHCSNDGKL
jgi:hypothetical protein